MVSEVLAPSHMGTLRCLGVSLFLLTGYSVVHMAQRIAYRALEGKVLGSIPVSAQFLPPFF